MMEITERANKYADGKANEAITTAIAQAYMDGYRDGYKDRQEEIPVEFRDKKTQYVDLGLPSGTLWSESYEKDEDGNIIYLPYGQANTFKLPSMEQWQELEKECRLIPNYNNYFILQSITCIGPNGNSIRFRTTGYYEVLKTDSDRCVFWIKDTLDEDNNAKTTSLYLKKDSHDLGIATPWMFSGYKIPVRLVR